MSPNYCNESMCEAKAMDPDSPESEDMKRDSKMVNGKTPPRSISPLNKDSDDFHHHHDHEQPFTPQSTLDDGDDGDGDISADDMISVGGSPSPGPLEPRRTLHRPRNSLEENIDDYFRPFIKLRMVKVEPPSSTSPAGLKSFSISDILSHKPNKTSIPSQNHHGNLSTAVHDLVVNQQRIVRPWDAQQQLQNHHHHHHRHHNHNNESQNSKSNGRRNSDSSPLDALFQMTSKTFEGLNGHHDGQDISSGGNAHQAFSSRQPPKKKRKSRTAFTNHQIFELEKRFLYQKYLSPADRDDIAQHLGLTNAQVITWFQNRRAKLKRDHEEEKKDLESAKILFVNGTLMESVQELGNLRKRVQNHVEMMNPAAAVAAAVAAASFRISSPTSSSFSSHSPINLTSESPPSTH